MLYTNVCKHCFKTFKSRYKRNTCLDCIGLDDAHFDEIEAYLKKYPNSNALQISEALGITAFEVLNYLKEGRLELGRGYFESIDEVNFEDNEV